MKRELALLMIIVVISSSSVHGHWACVRGGPLAFVMDDLLRSLSVLDGKLIKLRESVVTWSLTLSTVDEFDSATQEYSQKKERFNAQVFSQMYLASEKLRADDLRITVLHGTSVGVGLGYVYSALAKYDMTGQTGAVQDAVDVARTTIASFQEVLSISKNGLPLFQRGLFSVSSDPADNAGHLVDKTVQSVDATIGKVLDVDSQVLSDIIKDLLTYIADFISNRRLPEVNNIFLRKALEWGKAALEDLLKNLVQDSVNALIRNIGVRYLRPWLEAVYETDHAVTEVRSKRDTFVKKYEQISPRPARSIVDKINAVLNDAYGTIGETFDRLAAKLGRLNDIIRKANSMYRLLFPILPNISCPGFPNLKTAVTVVILTVDAVAFVYATEEGNDHIDGNPRWSFYDRINGYIRITVNALDKAIEIISPIRTR